MICPPAAALVCAALCHPLGARANFLGRNYTLYIVVCERDINIS